MTPERWQRVQDLFHAASEREPAERKAFLEEACADDRELRREVESMLASSEGVGNFLEAPALEAVRGELAESESEPIERLSRGQRLGQYEIAAPLGAGGMGEVWRARDVKLEREVALKVLPPELSENRERVRRFGHEARAASALTHPNIVTVYEIGSSESVSFIAMELVRGKTLRDLCGLGALRMVKLLDYGAQMARGLSCAHAAGIVHRDLKPENVMVNEDGVVKILDFGLAKLVRSPVEAAQGQSATASVATEPGVLLGTYGYMSPEQASGKTTDFRSDQFSFGSILYEMATGQKAFRRDSAIDTLSALVHEEPEPISGLNPKVPAPLRWIIERCHAKDPKDRYASTEDLARELDTLRTHLPEVSSVGGEVAPASRNRGHLAAVFTAAAIVAAVSTAAWLVPSLRRKPDPPRFQQLTFQGAGISTARFTPDGQSVVYAAQWEGHRPELFETRIDHPESRSLGLPSAQILSISRTGYMAILLLPPHGMTLRPPHADSIERFPLFASGTLAQVPLVGGAPRELLENVLYADWAPNGHDLAVARYVEGQNQLELPIGKVIIDHSDWINFLRVSPRGDSISFANFAAQLVLLDSSGKVTETHLKVWDHAWSPVTEEILYVDLKSGTTELRSLSRPGKDRLVATLPGDFALYDVSSTGAILLGRVSESHQIWGSFPTEGHRRLVDGATLEDLSDSGDLMTYTGGSHFDERPTAFVAKTDGSPPKRLGALGGLSGAVLSPDGKYVLGLQPLGGRAHVGPEPNVALVPVGPGATIKIPLKGLEIPGPFGFTPDGKNVFVSGIEHGRARRLWKIDISDGRRAPVTPEGIRRLCTSHDGRFATAIDQRGNWNVYSLQENGRVHKITGLEPGEEPFQWTSDSRWLYVRGSDEIKPGDSSVVTRVYRLDPWSGQRTLWKEIAPVSEATGGGIGTIRFSADGKTCVYNHLRYSSELFVAQGLK